MRIELSSPPDPPRLVASIFDGNSQIAEIREVGGVPRIELYPRPDGTFTEVDYYVFVNAIDEAWRRLRDQLEGAPS